MAAAAPQGNSNEGSIIPAAGKVSRELGNRLTIHGIEFIILNVVVTSDMNIVIGCKISCP